MLGFTDIVVECIYSSSDPDPFIGTDDKKQMDDKEKQELDEFMKEYFTISSSSETETVSLIETGICCICLRSPRS